MLGRIVQVFAVLKVLHLGALLYVWGQKWWELRSKHTLGLVLFSLFLLGENALAAYWFILHPDFSAWIHTEQMVPRSAQIALASFRVL